MEGGREGGKERGGGGGGGADLVLNELLASSYLCGRRDEL